MIVQEQARAFESLLRWLHADREQAGAVYEQLRVKLLRFFELHGCPVAEDCADETLHRVGLNLAAGLTVQAPAPYIYCRGVARNVLLEEWRKQGRTPAALDDLPPQRHPAFHPEEAAAREQHQRQRERKLDCLDGCLRELPPESRQLFIAYHRDQQRPRIDHRAALAAQQGIDVTALRNRVARLRKKMESCVAQCAGGGT